LFEAIERDQDARGNLANEAPTAAKPASETNDGVIAFTPTKTTLATPQTVNSVATTQKA
jgi:hypothetical protein